MPLILIKLEMPLPSLIVLSLGNDRQLVFCCKKMVGEMKKFMGLDVFFLKKSHQKFQVPKREVLHRIRLFWGVGVSLTKAFRLEYGPPFLGT